MKLSSTLILSGMVLAQAVFAQTEQSLQYHSSAAPRACLQVQLTTTPPPGVALPKLNASPWFARWLTPMDPAGGRWLCLDRTRKSGPYDRLFIDTSGNGRLDDKTPIAGRALDPSNAEFPAAGMVFKGEQGPVTYHLAFRLSQLPGSPGQLLASSAGWYEGMVNFDGVKKRIQIFDGNVNGTFNDMAADPYNSDRIQIEGDKTGERFLGRMLEVSGKFYRLEVARDGTSVKMQKPEDLALGEGHVPDSISEFTAYGENGHFVGKPVNGQITLPAGHYRIFRWTIDRKDEKGVPWTLSGYNFPKNAGFDVAADKTALLRIGEPVQVVLKATEGVNRQISFSLQFEGRQNESIEMLRAGQRPPGPKLVLNNAGGNLVFTSSFEFG
jgi:hypothetical protein